MDTDKTVKNGISIEKISNLWFLLLSVFIYVHLWLICFR